jgi:hypothetical protein
MLFAARQAGVADVLRKREREEGKTAGVDVEAEGEEAEVRKKGAIHERSYIRDILEEAADAGAPEAEANVKRRAGWIPPQVEESMEDAKSWWQNLLGGRSKK